MPAEWRAAPSFLGRGNPRNINGEAPRNTEQIEQRDPAGVHRQMHETHVVVLPAPDFAQRGRHVPVLVIRAVDGKYVAIRAEGEPQCTQCDDYEHQCQGRRTSTKGGETY